MEIRLKKVNNSSYLDSHPNGIFVSCNHCGEDLFVPKDLKFLNCGSCKSRLKLEESGGAIYTKVLPAVHKPIRLQVPTPQHKRSCIAQIEREVARLDRGWIITCGEFDNPSAKETPQNHSRRGLLFASLAAVLLVSAVVLTVATRNWNFVFPLFPGVGFIFGSMMNFARSRDLVRFYNAKSEYERKREKLLKELEGIKKQ